MSAPDRRKQEPLREKNGSGNGSLQQEVRRHIKDLLSDDFAARLESLEALVSYGENASTALVATLTNKTLPSQAVTVLSEALESIGKPSAAPIADAVQNFRELKTPDDVFLLESLIVTLGGIDDRTTTPAIREQLPRLRRATKENGSHLFSDACESARVCIHSILSERGDRSAVNDLLKLLGDGRSRVRDGIAQALARVGDRRALVPLARLYRIETGVSFAGAQIIREALRDIARREQATIDDPAFARLSQDERATVEQILRKGKNGNGNGRPKTRAVAQKQSSVS
jgi:hypothetical protein